MHPNNHPGGVVHYINFRANSTFASRLSVGHKPGHTIPPGSYRLLTSCGIVAQTVACNHCVECNIVDLACTKYRHFAAAHD